MSGFYDTLCNILIRPARQTYSDYDLGPPTIGNLALRHNFTFNSSQNHQIKASFYKQRNAVHQACILYLHSFNGSRLEPLGYIPETVKRGFHFVSLDFAGCGNSGGDYVSLGYHERWDALKLLHEIKQRFGVKEIIVWGRSMGAVTAIKLYTSLLQEQTQGRLCDVKILGLVLDSAFISLKRMVVEVGQTRIHIPQFLIKAIFLMVGSSIQQRANFKMQELQLQPQLQKIRCPVMLIASKEDTFVSHVHSEEIFAKLPFHEHKHLEYTNGEHYQHRNGQVTSTILKFIEQKYKIFNQNNSQQLRISHCLKHDTSIQRHSRSLRKYEPRKQAEIAMEERIQRPCSGQRGQTVKFTQMKMHQFINVNSEKRLDLAGEGLRPYQTEKKIQGPLITFTLGGQKDKLRIKDCLRSKSKPNFTGKPPEIICRREEPRRAGSSQHHKGNQQENHLNIITGKLRKKTKTGKEPIQFQSNRVESHVNSIRFQINKNSHSPLAITREEKEKPKKLSMTAQQYKNNQIKVLKGIVHLSPSVKRKAMKQKMWQQSKSSTNLNGGGSQILSHPHLQNSSKLNLVKEGCWTPRKE